MKDKVVVGSDSFGMVSEKEFKEAVHTLRQAENAGFYLVRYVPRYMGGWPAWKIIIWCWFLNRLPYWFVSRYERKKIYQMEGR